MDPFTKYLIVAATGLGILVPAATGAAQLASNKDKDSYTSSSYYAEVFFCSAAAFMIVLGGSFMIYYHKKNKASAFMQSNNSLTSGQAS